MGRPRVFIYQVIRCQVPEAVRVPACLSQSNHPFGCPSSLRDNLITSVTPQGVGGQMALRPHSIDPPSGIFVTLSIVFKRNKQIKCKNKANKANKIDKTSKKDKVSKINKYIIVCYF